MLKDYYGYRVSDDGRIYGKKGQLLKHSISNRGVHMVNLYIDRCNYVLSVKTIVALLFVDRPEGCDVVKVLDGNNDNLSYDNLMWIPKAVHINERSKKCMREMNGKVTTYLSASNAARSNGVSPAVISKWCRGLMKDKRGYKWEYS